ncbi:MAG: helicase-related protein, partial [bacterium]|nr:helicase-related protein [bacterium]
IFVWSKSLGWNFLKFASIIGLKIKNQTLNFEINKEIKYDIGIAFHNADIPLDERQIIEQEFRDESSDLRILVATQTLALGVNLPADTAFINIKSYYENDGFQILPSVLDILQEEGRVGRFGLRTEGNSFRVFWSVPSNLRNYLINIENVYHRYDKHFSNSSFYNILSVLILSS